MATYSVNWSAVLSSTSGSVAVGSLLCMSSNGTHFVATTANRASYGRTVGIAATTGDSTTPVVQMIETGIVPASITGLAAGAVSWVRCSSAGVLERVTPGSGDDLVGQAHADGSVQFCPGMFDVDNYAGGGITAPTGTGIATVTSGAFDAAVPANVLAGSGYISIGATPATAGGLRLANNTFVYARNAANNANVEILGLTAGDVIELGASTGSAITIGAGLGQVVKIEADDVGITGSVQIGAAVPDVGGSTGGAIGITDSSAPGSNPVGGIVMYSLSGVGKIRQADGTIVTLANVSTTAGVCTLEDFGAVGDGVTNDQAAYAAAIAAMPATYKTILLGAKTYLVTGATLPAGCSIVGQGDASILKTTGTAAVVVIGGDYCTLRDFKLTGTAGSVVTQCGVRNGTAGAAGTGYMRLRIHGVSALTFGGAGFLMQSTDGTLSTLGPQLSDCTADDCGSNATPGAGFDIRAEYTNLTNCVARNCLGPANNSIGLWVYAGNVTWTGGQVMLNGIGIQIDPSGNDAHGIVSSAEINHNNVGLQLNAFTSGHTFDACHIYANQIWMVGCDGVRFHGGVISTDIVFQGSTNTRFTDVTFPSSGTINLFQSYLGNASTEEFTNCRALDGSPLVGAAAHTNTNLVTDWQTGRIAVQPPVGATYTELVSNLVAKRIEYAAGGGIAAAQAITYPTPIAARNYFEKTIRNDTGFTLTFNCGAGATIAVATAKTAILGFSDANAGDVVRITADT